MLTGLILPTETFSNVMIDNGKVISDGNRNIVLGFTTPGLKGSLGINEDTSITLPESLEISADVTDFRMSSTFTVGLSDLFDQLNLKDISDMDSLKSSLDELEDAAMQLVDGSSQLSEGADTLGSSYGEFDAGIQTLKTGMTHCRKELALCPMESTAIPPGLISSMMGFRLISALMES